MTDVDKIARMVRENVDCCRRNGWSVNGPFEVDELVAILDDRDRLVRELADMNEALTICYMQGAASVSAERDRLARERDDVEAALIRAGQSQLFGSDATQADRIDDLANDYFRAHSDKLNAMEERDDSSALLRGAVRPLQDAAETLRRLPRDNPHTQGAWKDAVELAALLARIEEAINPKENAHVGE